DRRVRRRRRDPLRRAPRSTPMIFASRILFAAAASTVALLGCAPTPTSETLGTTDDTLRVPTAPEIVGDSTYGDARNIAYAEVPSFRAFRLAGKEGDPVDLWVRSTMGGDAIAWLVREDGTTFARNDDAAATTKDAHLALRLPRTETYFVVMRDANYED